MNKTEEPVTIVEVCEERRRSPVELINYVNDMAPKLTRPSTGGHVIHLFRSFTLEKVSL